MADISTYLKQILSAVYGEDVRQAIHDAIQQCYTDGSAVSDAVADIINSKVTELIQQMVEDGTLSDLAVEASISDQSITGNKISYEAINKHLLDSELKTHLTDAEKFYLSAVVSTYTVGSYDDNGEYQSSGTYQTTDQFLKCYPAEVLKPSSANVVRIYYYDADKAFLSYTATSTGINEYTVPEDAEWFKLLKVYNGGNTPVTPVRDKEFYNNASFYDVIMSPYKTRPNIQIVGDSNTYGYGLSDTSLSWANRLITAIERFTGFEYCFNSKWVNSVGYNYYYYTANFKPYSYMEIVTDAEEITLSNSGNYSSTWQWYIDGETDSANDSVETIALDGEQHTVRVYFTGGQLVAPSFVINKTFNFVNSAVTGTSTSNMTVDYTPDYWDWTLMMIGTNNRTTAVFGNEYFAYIAKNTTYICPFPTYKMDSSYTLSLMETVAKLKGIFSSYGAQILDCNDVALPIFYSGDCGYYQSDLIHFNEDGHRIIANIVSAKLGIPLYLTMDD